MASDTTRHAGRGLHNRRAPVRFLSHLPASPEFMRLQRHAAQPTLRALTTIDPNDSNASNASNASKHVIYAHRVIDFLVQQRDLVACAQAIATYLCIALSTDQTWGTGQGQGTTLCLALCA